MGSTMFYWVLLIFIGFLQVLLVYTEFLIGFDWVLLGFTGFYGVFIGFDEVLLYFIGCYGI